MSQTRSFFSLRVLHVRSEIQTIFSLSLLEILAKSSGISNGLRILEGFLSPSVLELFDTSFNSPSSCFLASNKRLPNDVPKRRRRRALSVFLSAVIYGGRSKMCLLGNGIRLGVGHEDLPRGGARFELGESTMTGGGVARIPPAIFSPRASSCWGRVSDSTMAGLLETDPVLSGVSERDFDCTMTELLERISP